MACSVGRQRKALHSPTMPVLIATARLSYRGTNCPLSFSCVPGVLCTWERCDRTVGLRTQAIIALLVSLIPLLAIGDSYTPLRHHAFTHDGVSREYFVHVPRNHAGKLPVVFAIHGYTSTATGFAVFHDLRQHADENGYIVVYPQSTHFVDTNTNGPYRVTSWNMFGDVVPAPGTGPQCTEDADRYPCPPECGTCDRCDWASCNDDLGYFEKMLDEISSGYNADVSRYYALGMSNGGMPHNFQPVSTVDRARQYQCFICLVARMTWYARMACRAAMDLFMYRRPTWPPPGPGFCNAKVVRTIGRRRPQERRGSYAKPTARAQLKIRKS